MDQTIIEEHKIIDENVSKDFIAMLSFNRPQVANALNQELIKNFTQIIEELEINESCRAVVIQGKGKHFSAGADLQWMQESYQLGREENFKEAKTLARMFEALYRLSKPSIAIVTGAAFGGALGLVACCDLSIATPDASFCLSEVNVGLVPAVILPYLAHKIHSSNLRYLMLSGKKFSSSYAKDIGLVQVHAEKKDLETCFYDELNQLLSSGPQAIRKAKSLHQYLQNHTSKEDEVMADAISSIRVSPEAQHGLQSFLNKDKADWILTIKEKWKLDA